MLRYLLVGLNFLIFYFIDLFFGGVTITTEVPEKAEPDSEFTVSITINKGDINGFAKLQQVLPQGFTATVIESAGASFTFNDQTIKLIWMSLPASESFTVSYKVTVGQDVKGIYGFGGKFSYLDGNQKRTIPIPDKQIQVGESEAETVSEAAPVPAEAICSRSFEKISDTEWRVHILIVKKGIDGFAKVEDFLPTGISGSADNAEEYVVSFVDQKMKFVWMNLPPEDSVQLEYIAHLETAGFEALDSITGKFSFLENNETRKEPIITLAPATGASLAENSEDNGQQKAKEDSIRAAEEARLKAEQEAALQAEAEAARLKAEEEQRLALEEARKRKEEKMAKNKPNLPDSINTVAKIPSPETGISYKVQICAGHKPVPGSHFKTQYKYSDSKVNIEQQGGWLKYTIGLFGVYKDAHDKRDQVTAKYDFPGPFVTAYNEGARITVQEALMITKQQWYQ